MTPDLRWAAALISVTLTACGGGNSESRGQSGESAASAIADAAIEQISPPDDPGQRMRALSVASTATSALAGLNAEYFANATLSGTPLVRRDANVDFDWGQGGPSGLPTDNFSVRWTGQLIAATAGVHLVGTVSDDGVRLWIDGVLVIDRWTDHGPTQDSVALQLSTGPHSVQMEYYERGGGAVAKLIWQPPGATSPVAIPAASLSTTPVASGVSAQYFANTTLTGTPITRSEASVDFDWGTGGPVGLPTDNFSARWTAPLTASTDGSYVIGTLSDDGVRLWVDGTKVIDNWTTHAPTQNTVTLQLSAGVHSILMEYFEQAGGATAKLLWQPPGSGALTAIPAVAFIPSAPAPSPAPAPAPASEYLSPSPAAPDATSPVAFTGYVYVVITGNDATGDGSSQKPYRSLWKASQVATPGKTIKVGAGTFLETRPSRLALGVSIEGAGQDITVLTATSVALSAGVSPTDAYFKLSPEGSLIQLLSQTFQDPTQSAGSPANMVATADGRQTLSGFTIDGNGKSLKAGVWVQNRNNVTMHHVSFRDLQQRGAVFARSNMDWYVPLPDAMWMRNTIIHDCSFINSGADLDGETLGNLNIGGLDGASIYNIRVDDTQGYGIKFMYVGHFRNVRIWNADIKVSEADALWGEDASIELWNVSRGNEIFNVNSNTWFSIVNHPGIYSDVTSAKDNLWIHHVRIIDNDGKSGKEAIEVAAPGMTISDSYFQDKGLGLGIWMQANNQITVANNIIARPRNVDPSWASEAAIFVPDTTMNLNIYNNVIDRAGTAIHMRGTIGNVNIKNNLILDSVNQDVYSASSHYTFTNNLKSNANNSGWNLAGITPNASNPIHDPGLLRAGDRWNGFYRPAGASSFVVNRGTNVGLPYLGSAPEIGRWELGQ